MVSRIPETREKEVPVLLGIDMSKLSKKKLFNLNVSCQRGLLERPLRHEVFTFWVKTALKSKLQLWSLDLGTPVDISKEI